MLQNCYYEMAKSSTSFMRWIYHLHVWLIKLYGSIQNFVRLLQYRLVFTHGIWYFCSPFPSLWLLFLPLSSLLSFDSFSLYCISWPSALQYLIPTRVKGLLWYLKFKQNFYSYYINVSIKTSFLVSLLVSHSSSWGGQSPFHVHLP